MHLRILFTALALFGTTAPLAAQSWPAPLVKIEGLRQISDHVYVIPDNSVPVVPNVGYIIGDHAALVVDTGLGPPNGEAVYGAARKLAGTRTLYLVTTHVHPEHDLGAQAFPDTTKLIRSTDQVNEIAEDGLRLAKIFAGRSAAYSDLLKDADFRRADITFERDYVLDLGGVRARLTAMGPNHTVGDTIIWVEPDRLLFAGDLAMKAQPAFASSHSSLRQWLASLDRLEALKPAMAANHQTPPPAPAPIPAPSRSETPANSNRSLTTDQMPKLSPSLDTQSSSGSNVETASKGCPSTSPCVIALLPPSSEGTQNQTAQKSLSNDFDQREGAQSQTAQKSLSNDFDQHTGGFTPVSLVKYVLMCLGIALLAYVALALTREAMVLNEPAKSP